MPEKPAFIEIKKKIEELYSFSDGVDALDKEFIDRSEMYDQDELSQLLHSAVKRHEERHAPKEVLEKIIRLIVEKITSPVDDQLILLTKDYELIEILLKKGANPNVADNDGRTPLMMAQNSKTVKILLGAGADPNAVDHKGQTPLMAAADHSFSSAYIFKPEADLNMVKFLLDAGADPNAATKDGVTPLIKAREPESVKLLLAAGADPNAVTNAGRTPLMTASDPESIKLLLAAGANPNAVDKDGDSALFHHASSASIKLLLNAGTDAKTINKSGLTSIMKAISSTDWRSDSLAKSVALLIKAGADVNHKDQNGRTALMLACSGGNRQDVLDLLAKAGADINAVDMDGNSALKCSPKYGSSFEALGSLIAHEKTIIDLPNNAGETPLMFWAGNEQDQDSRKVVEALLKKGADVKKTDSQGLDALMYAARSRNERCIKLLLQKKSDPRRTSHNGWTCLEWAVSEDGPVNQKLIDALLDGGAQINGSNSAGEDRVNLLGRVLLDDNYEYARALLQRGARIDRAVLATMGITHKDLADAASTGATPPDAKTAAGKLLALSSRAPDLFPAALDEQDGIMAGLSAAESTGPSDLEGPLTKLLPSNWPPRFPERKPILVPNVAAKPFEPQVLFLKEEYADYLGKYPTHVKDGQDSDVDEELNSFFDGKRSCQVPFSKIKKASNETLSRLWNEKALDFVSRVIVKESYQGFWGGSSDIRPISTQEYLYLLARCGPAVVPGFISLAKTKPNMVCRLLFPVADSRFAILMAGRLFGSTVTRVVKKWLLRHPEAALHGLIPVAVGKPSRDRDNCEAALRFMAGQGLESAIREVAGAYGAEVLKAVEEILSVDRCYDYHRKTLPSMPTALREAGLKLPVVKETGAPLSDHALTALAGMMSLSSYDDVYPDLEIIRPLLEPESLAEFAWEVFQVWETKSWRTTNVGWEEEKKLKKEAEWMYHCLAYMGSDSTVKNLLPLINSWPKTGGMTKAVTGLDILANLGSDYAVRTINNILLKTKYKPLLERAEDIMETIADVRGLSREQLDDRLVPALGLDDPGALLLDYGARSFPVVIDEKLIPTIVDGAGKKMAVLPTPGKTDNKAMAKDAEARWKELKAELKKEAPIQLLRLEQAMLNGRTWPADDFRSLLVEHPLLRYPVRHLVWAEEKDGKIVRLFRVDEKGTYLDVAGNMVQVDPQSSLGIPHPLRFQSQIAAWTTALAKNKVKQPVPQVGRQFFLMKQDINGDLFGVNGARIPSGAIRGLKAKGWEMVMEGINSLIGGCSKECSTGSVELKIREGNLFLVGGGGLNDKELQIRVTVPKGLTDIEYSEVVRDLKELMY